MLIAKKDGLEHGQWLPWLKANAEVLGFKDRAANLLMKWAAANPQLTADLDFDTAAAASSRQLWGNKPRIAQSAGHDKWFTPAEYVELARSVLGEIDLDPASCDAAQETVRAKKFLTAETDGLTRKWLGRVFLNPPYSHPLIDDFIAKLCAELNAGHTAAAVLLTNNCTDTAWFHQAAAAADVFCFTKGRIDFREPTGKNPHPTQGQIFFYFGPDPERFAAVFETAGSIARPWRPCLK
jgi:phage N-6-adenine-methyltransferase